MRKKPILLRLLPWIIVLVLIAGAYIVLDKIYSSPGHSFARDPKILTYDGDGKPLTMENDQLLFEMDGSTTQFKVTNKETGKVWNGTVDTGSGLFPPGSDGWVHRICRGNSMAHRP